MAFEQIGKISNRLRILFAICSVIFLLVLAISPLRDQFREWKHYKRAYVRFAESRPETRKLLADYHSGINQIWLPQFNVTDRCTTCHQGIDQPSLTDVSTPEPFRAHPMIPHRATDWGCVVCHQGQGLATEIKEAHQATLAWEAPLLPISYIQGTCGVCHRQSMPETPRLDRGRDVMGNLHCVGCHKLQGIDRPVMLGPDLTNVGNKTSREWIFKWLKDPRTITDASGNVSVDGYESEEEPRMPRYRLNERELKALSVFLGAQKTDTIGPYRFDSHVLASWGKKPDAADQGEARFRQMFCSTCHSLAVVRGGETQLIGGDIGPELSKVGSKVGTDWFVFWLRNPQAYLPHALMPRYGWSDEDLYIVARYVMDRLTDPDLLKNVPGLLEAQTADIQLGTRLFQEKGCSSCHLITGIKTQQDFGPDLSAEGAKTVSQLDFGDSKIPHTLISFLEAKISDPVSVNSNARMPQYHFKEGDLQALTTAALGMKGQQSMPGIGTLVPPATKPEYHPAGDFGKAYERYKCYVCHRFFGYGSTLAPDLSYEGSRAQHRWMVDFLKNPQTLRPTLIFRMPQFNMTDQEAEIIAEYLSLVLQTDRVDLSTANLARFTPEQTLQGKQLYEMKYQCHSCHTIGAAGGYVGPNLINTGNWLNTAWIQGWLKDPQALVPDTIEPRRGFTPEEVQALTAYLVSLKQSAITKPAAAAGGLQ
jgi:cbb3-type cytochrome oxidase cytochrome c subunit